MEKNTENLMAKSSDFDFVRRSSSIANAICQNCCWWYLRCCCCCCMWCWCCCWGRLRRKWRIHKHGMCKQLNKRGLFFISHFRRIWLYGDYKYPAICFVFFQPTTYKTHFSFVYLCLSILETWSGNICRYDPATLHSNKSMSNVWVCDDNATDFFQKHSR